MMAGRLPVQIVDDELKAGLLQIARHAAAHRTQPYESDYDTICGHRVLPFRIFVSAD
jgi:hypothetical protein